MKSPRFLILSIALNVILVAIAILWMTRPADSPESASFSSPTPAEAAPSTLDSLAPTLAEPSADLRPQNIAVSDEPARPLPAAGDGVQHYPVDPTQPGNSVTYGGLVASIVETTIAPGAEDRDLVIEFSPKPAASDSAASLQSSDSGEPSQEEELFRSKWGWEAYDKVRTAARQQINSSASAQ